MYPGSSCYGGDGNEKITAAAGGFSMLSPNKKVGMPVTEARNKILNATPVNDRNELALHDLSRSASFSVRLLMLQWDFAVAGMPSGKGQLGNAVALQNIHTISSSVPRAYLYVRS